MAKGKKPEDRIREHERDRHEVALATLRGEVKEQKRRANVAIQRHAALQERFDTALQLATYKPPKKVARPKAKTSRRLMTAYACASDWHIEEEVLQTDVPGVDNQYNLEISQARSQAFFQGLVALLRKHTRDYEIHHLYLGLLGDFITGWLRDEDREKNLLAPTDAMMRALDYLAWGIRLLLQETDMQVIYVICQDGNHERIHEKPQIRTGHINSYTWIMYHILRRLFQDEKRVVFQVSESTMAYTTDPSGHVTRWAHGDHGFRYNGGIMGLGVPAWKWLMRVDESCKADTTVIGHYHTLGFYGQCKLVTNGSLIGTNGYSLSLGFSEPPQQAFWLVDYERGPCQMSPIWVSA